MNGNDWNNWVRQAHRWISIAFTLTVIANIAAISLQGTPPNWVTYSPLPPLFVLQITGLYLFFLPYVAKKPSGKQPASEEQKR